MQRTLWWSRSLSFWLPFFFPSLDRPLDPVHARETLSCTSFPFPFHFSDLSFRSCVCSTDEIALKMIARFIVVVHASQVFFFLFFEQNVSNHLTRNITCVSHVTIVRPAGCGNLWWIREDLESGTKCRGRCFRNDLSIVLRTIHLLYARFPGNGNRERGFEISQ